MLQTSRVPKGYGDWHRRICITVEYISYDLNRAYTSRMESKNKETLQRAHAPGEFPESIADMRRRRHFYSTIAALLARRKFRKARTGRY